MHEIIFESAISNILREFIGSNQHKNLFTTSLFNEKVLDMESHSILFALDLSSGCSHTQNCTENLPQIENMKINLLYKM